MNFIQGNKFKSLAKWHYAPARLYTGDEYRDAINNFHPGDYRFLLNTLEKDKLQDGDIIYTHTFYADQLFEVLEKLDKKVTVVTHNCDININFAPPDQVIKWFSQNVNIIHDRVFSVPLGIENDFWLKDKKNKMLRKLNQKRKFKRMLYMNHNISTNPAKREEPYKVLGGKPWVTTGNGANGAGFDVYLDNIYNHPFVVCPEGNGIDTHRVWECLYMKTIPIQVRNINNSFYTDLPILFIDDWGEVNEKFLCDEYLRIMDAKWNMDKLDFDYWKKIISG